MPGSTKKDVMNVLERVNEDLSKFIKTRIQEGVLSAKEWSSLFQDTGQKRCWEILGCNNMECPIHGQDEYRCWLIAGTLCGGKVQGAFAEKIGNCMQCEIYKLFHVNPIRSLYENISILIFHMSDEAFKFHRKATTDSLTGLLNRASFDEIMEQEIKRSKRLNTPLSIIEFDLDCFKEINDQGGHLAGDRYLIEFASILRNSVRDVDFAFRTGGDEFIVLMIGSSEKSIHPFIDRIQNKVAKWNGIENIPSAYPLSCSGGGACLNDFGFDVKKCIGEADRRMYRNKKERKAGR